MKTFKPNHLIHLSLILLLLLFQNCKFEGLVGTNSGDIDNPSVLGPPTPLEPHHACKYNPVTTLSGEAVKMEISNSGKYGYVLQRHRSAADPQMILDVSLVCVDLQSKVVRSIANKFFTDQAVQFKAHSIAVNADGSGVYYTTGTSVYYQDFASGVFERVFDYPDRMGFEFFIDVAIGKQSNSLYILGKELINQGDTSVNSAIIFKVNPATSDYEIVFRGIDYVGESSYLDFPYRFTLSTDESSAVITSVTRNIYMANLETGETDAVVERLYPEDSAPPESPFGAIFYGWDEADDIIYFGQEQSDSIVYLETPFEPLIEAVGDDLLARPDGSLSLVDPDNGPIIENSQAIGTHPNSEYIYVFDALPEDSSRLLRVHKDTGLREVWVE